MEVCRHPIDVPILSFSSVYHDSGEKMTYATLENWNSIYIMLSEQGLFPLILIILSILTRLKSSPQNE